MKLGKERSSWEATGPAPLGLSSTIMTNSRLPIFRIPSFPAHRRSGVEIRQKTILNNMRATTVHLGLGVSWCVRNPLSLFILRLHNLTCLLQCTFFAICRFRFPQRTLWSF